MGLRYRKSINIIPGVRLNISKSGISTSVGKRGSTVNFSSRGTRATVGIPGTGLSYSTMVGKRRRRVASSNRRLNELRAEMMDRYGVSGRELKRLEKEIKHRPRRFINMSNSELADYAKRRRMTPEKIETCLIVLLVFLVIGFIASFTSK